MRFLLSVVTILVGAATVQAQQSVARIWNERLLNAIRVDTPHPPKHARNLFHVATAMYDAWAAYDTTAIGYLHHERDTAADVPAARHEAISYAAYRVLKNRFASGPGAVATNAAIDAQMATFGYNVNTTTTIGTSPAAVGNRIAATILAWGLTDGSNEAGNYLDPTYSNPQPPMIVLLGGVPQGQGVPIGTDPNRWQPLAFDAAFTQNGLQADLIQKYVGVTWLGTAPFAHTRQNPSLPWIDPGPPSKLGTATDAEYKSEAFDLLRKSSQLNSTELINISPGGWGNNPLGEESGTGRPLNPATNLPYAPEIVKLGDFARVLAEFWADGPDSETPPGHWHVLANEVADHPLTQKRIGGVGPIVDDLEWDVKTYFAVSASTHDAACAAWGIKRYYESPRPVTMIRYMCSKGQSSDPLGPAYHPQGIPLEPGICEVITSATAAPGGRHEGVGAVGEIAVFAWPGEPADRATQTSPVRWIRGIDWLPYQRQTFNTPAFPGYISGHSTFSRAAAEVLAALTGSPFFPGGMNHYTADANTYLVFERGPSQTIDLQWATYFDAADQAGLSRRFGGIHPREDDLPGRIIGSQCGLHAWTMAQKYWDGSILNEGVVPTVTYQIDGSAVVTAKARRGLFYRLQSSIDLNNWTNLTGDVRATDTTIALNDPSAAGGAKFYRILWDAAVP